MKKTSASNRIQWFHRTILSNGFPNSTLLAERFGISRTQAKRDIQFLQKNLGAPLSYDPSKRGYSYTGEYSLPVAVTTANDEEFSGLIASAGSSSSLTGDARTDEKADITFLQLQIPYSAVLEIKDKLAVVELKPYILRKEPGKAMKNCYKCEFHSVERFLGVLLSIDADIRIVSPDWLREQLVTGAERVLRVNRSQNEPE